MADDRIYVRCRKCGEQTMLLQLVLDLGSYLPSEHLETIPRFFDRHIRECFDFYGLRLRASPETMFRFVSEGDMATEERAESPPQRQ